MSPTVKNLNPHAIKVSKILFSIETVPTKEQKIMVRRAVMYVHHLMERLKANED